MLKHTIYKIRAICTMAKANFDSWLNSPRTLIMFLFVGAFSYVVTNNFRISIENLPYDLGFLEAVFYMIFNGCNITMTSVLFLITVSELPRRIGFQYNMLIRSSRNLWLFSQILYCLWMVLLMLGLVTVCTSMVLAPVTSLNNEWCEAKLIAEKKLLSHESLIPAFIRNNFTPITACLYALLPMFLFWLAMVLVILFCGMFNVPSLGVILYALMLVANVVFMLEFIGGIPMPIYYSTLNNIIRGAEGREWGKITDAMIKYSIMILTLVFGMFIRAKKADLIFISK